MDSDIHRSSTDSDVTSVHIEKTAEIADILRNRRRIQVILELESDGEEEISVSELADRIVESEHGSGFDSTQRQRIFVALYQSHVPKLDADDVIEIDSDRDVVTRGSRFAEVVGALDRLQQ